MAKIVGIGGVSRSGKSRLANRLVKHFANKKTLIISQDEYVNAEVNIPKVRDRTDWEHPDSIDFTNILKAIDENRGSHDLIIIEGLLAFYNSTLDALYDHRIMVTISKDTFLYRRRKETRWGIEPEWFWEHVWDSYSKYGQVSSDMALYVSGEDLIDHQTFEDIVKNITI